MRQTFTPQAIVLLFHKYPEKPTASLTSSLRTMIRIGNLDAWIQSRDKIEFPNPYHSSTHPCNAGPRFSPSQQTQKLTTYSHTVRFIKIIDDLWQIVRAVSHRKHNVTISSMSPDLVPDRPNPT